METQEVTLDEVTLDQVVALLDDRYDLTYVDYRDNLNEHLDLVQKAFHENDLCVLDEQVWEWFMDAEWEAVDYALDELTERVQINLLPVEDESDRLAVQEAEELAQEFVEEHREELQYAIEERNCSNPLGDLLRNSSAAVAFYDVAECVDGYCYEDVIAEMRRILDIDEGEYEQELSDIVNNACDAGNLVIFFNIDLDDLLELDGNTITFENPMVALIDVTVGTGWHGPLIGHTVTMPFRRDRLFLDRTIKYSYTYEVCGMYEDWCSCTKVKVTSEEDTETPESSPINDHLSQETRYNEVFRGGSCSVGDMDVKRHRDVKYHNEPPFCRLQCPHCGTYWID